MSDEAISTFCRAILGRACAVEKRDYDWVFRFGDHSLITVSAPWRILKHGKIEFADTDDGQKFGFAQPIIGVERSNTLVMGNLVTSVEVDAATADLRVYFDGETRLELFNHSSGYEGWQASCSLDGAQILIIGLGGGGLTVFRWKVDTPN